MNIFESNSYSLTVEWSEGKTDTKIDNWKANKFIK